MTAPRRGQPVTLNTLLDVDITAGPPADGDAPIWDNATKKYKPGPVATGSTVRPAYDEYGLITAGAQTITLSFLPIDASEHVYLNGVEQQKGTDWTRSGQNLSVLTAMGTLSGDVLEVRYLYDTSSPGAATPTSLNPTTNGGTGTSMTCPLDAGVQAGDLLLFSVSTTEALSRVTASGWTLLFSSSDGTGTGTGDTRNHVVFYKTAGVGEGPATATCTGSQDYRTMVRPYRGTSGIYNHAANFTGSENTHLGSWSTPQLPVAAGRLLVHWWFNYTAFGAVQVNFPSGVSHTAQSWASPTTNASASGDEVISASGISTLRTATAVSGTAYSWAGLVVLL